MRTPKTFAALAIAACTTMVLAAESTTLNLAGIPVQSGVNSEVAAGLTIEPAPGYKLRFSDDVSLVGVSGPMLTLFPSPTPIEDVIQTFDPSANWDKGIEVLNGAETHPFTVFERTFSGATNATGQTVSLSMTLSLVIGADNVPRFTVTDVTTSPRDAALAFASGDATVSRNEADCPIDIDFNNDGVFPDSTDLFDFLHVFAGGACPAAACDPIDFNNDGVFPDMEDVKRFINAFAGDDRCP